MTVTSNDNAIYVVTPVADDDLELKSTATQVTPKVPTFDKRQEETIETKDQHLADKADEELAEKF